MTYYSMNEYKHMGFQKSTRKGKKYDALLKRKSDDKIVKIPFGDNTMESFHDKTKLNLYPNLIHGDPVRRKAYHSRHRVFLKEGYYSSGYYSFYFLW